MLIAKGSNMDYEQVKIDEFITGKIVEVQAKMGVTKQYKNKDTGEMEERTTDQVRFKFQLEGYEYPHYSRWNNLSTNENSNLYKKYIKGLFGDKFPPDSTIDVELLNQLDVKVRWDETDMKNGGKFQFVDKIRLLNPSDAENINLIAEDEEQNLQKELDDIPPEED